MLIKKTFYINTAFWMFFISDNDNPQPSSSIFTLVVEIQLGIEKELSFE